MRFLPQPQRREPAILKPGQKASWGGYSGYFSDPDNFVWEVVYNPFFSVTADGNIMLSTP